MKSVYDCYYIREHNIIPNNVIQAKQCNQADKVIPLTGLQKVWKPGRSFLGNRTCSREINQLQVK